MQKLHTKFHINRTIEPRVVTVHTQIASGHLSIFVIYLHIDTDISKSFKVPGDSFWHVLPMICAKYC